MIGKPFNFTWLLGNRFSNDYGINYRTGKFETSYKIRTSSKKKCGNFMNGPQDGGMWLLLRNRSAEI